jgi:hypothetical protein
MVAPPGYERLVAWFCAGAVGAVLCFDASRLARTGRDWHRLELCGLVEVRVIDLDGAGHKMLRRVRWRWDGRNTGPSRVARRGRRAATGAVDLEINQTGADVGRAFW